MAKYTVILSYGEHSDDNVPTHETYLAHIDTPAWRYGIKGDVEAAVTQARNDIRKQNGWSKKQYPADTFPVLYVFYGHSPCIQSQMD